MLANPVTDITDRLLDALDTALPARIEGLYLVGSIALADFQPGRSDVDFVAVVDGTLTPEELVRLEAAHSRLAQTTFDGIYVSWDDLAEPPRPEVGSANVSATAFERQAGFNANPAIWRTLSRHALAVRGPSPEAIEIYDSDEGLATFCRENLEGYWRSWGNATARLSRDGLFGLTDRGVEWGALGPLRLHCSATTGQIISKSEAADYGLETFGGRWQLLLEQARETRRTGARQPVATRIRRRRELVELVRYVSGSLR